MDHQVAILIDQAVHIRRRVPRRAHRRRDPIEDEPRRSPRRAVNLAVRAGACDPRLGRWAAHAEHCVGLHALGAIESAVDRHARDRGAITRAAIDRRPSLLDQCLPRVTMRDHSRVRRHSDATSPRAPPRLSMVAWHMRASGACSGELGRRVQRGGWEGDESCEEGGARGWAHALVSSLVHREREGGRVSHGEELLHLSSDGAHDRDD